MAISLFIFSFSFVSNTINARRWSTDITVSVFHEVGVGSMKILEL